MKLGKAISEGRKAKGLTIEELAKGCQLSVSYISNLEAGNENPTVDELESISKLIGIPVPILTFMSLKIEDIATEKREAFKSVMSEFKEVVKEMYSIED